MFREPTKSESLATTAVGEDFGVKDDGQDVVRAEGPLMSPPCLHAN